MTKHSANYETAEVYRGLRDRVFSSVPDASSIKDQNAIWAVVMEIGRPGGAITLLAVEDGTVSVYFSGGGGIIGLGPREGPKAAAQELLAMAPDFLRHCAPVTDFPLPKEEHTQFYLITYHGTSWASATDAVLANVQHPLGALFRKGHALIAEIRKVDDAFRASKSGKQ